MIRVTRQHIDAGGFGSRHCPVALAVTEQTGRPCIVGTTSMWFEGANPMFGQPDSVMVFTEQYDAREPVEPFEFELPAGMLQ